MLLMGTSINNVTFFFFSRYIGARGKAEPARYSAAGVLCGRARLPADIASCIVAVQGA